MASLSLSSARLALFVSLGLLALLLPAFGRAAYDDVTLGGSSNTVFTINGLTLNVTGTSALISQVVANANTLVVTLAPGSTISISSPARATLSHDAASVYVAQDSCESGQSVLALSFPTSQSGSSAVITITPSSTTCTSGGGSSGGGGGGPVSSGGGGGGGGGSSSPAPAPSPTPTPSPAPSSAPSAALYTRRLAVGATGDDVVALQAWLEANGYLVMPPGVAKGYFGNATKRAVIALQKMIGLAPLGQVGPATRAYLNGQGNQAPAPAPAPTPAPAAGQYTRHLAVGATGDDVITLQTFLESKGFLVVPPGVAKGFFGGLTKKALAAFQVSIGLEGVGELGPATRAYLNSH